MEFPEQPWLPLDPWNVQGQEQTGMVGIVLGMILKVPSHPNHSLFSPYGKWRWSSSYSQTWIGIWVGIIPCWIWDPLGSIGFSGNVPTPSSSLPPALPFLLQLGRNLGRNFPCGNGEGPGWNSQRSRGCPGIPGTTLEQSGTAKIWDKLLLQLPSTPNPWNSILRDPPCSSRYFWGDPVFLSCFSKQFLFSRAFPEQDVYTTPVYFSSDWLNEYWDAAAGDDFRFVYMGPKGSWTPFHADVFRSYSWSANVCGRKRWLLYPAGHEEFLRDRHGNLPFDVTAPDLRDERIYPRSGRSQPPLEILQEAGEIVFIPSGWHHQVHNLEDTISINHNWVNGCNVAAMWSFLQDELAAVQRELGQWRDPMDDWHLQCQLIMKSCTGIDYKEFYNFLRVVAENRISVLEKGLDEESSSQRNSKAAISALGMLHAVFDLKRAAQVLSSLSANEDFRRLGPAGLGPAPEALLQRLQAAIDTALL
uniref:Jumonji domain-containing protein 4 n=1 Tax=Junco hyemalis TaxID=40217 RepID=A0A8C5NQ55_JUNHY